MSNFKLMVVIASMFFSAQSFAAGFGDKVSPEARNSAIITAILSSDKTPKEAKDLLQKVISGQEYEDRVSIISIEEDAALGQRGVTIRVGVDNLTDDDTGWGSVYDIDAIFQRNSRGDYYKLKSVSIELVAG